MYNFDVEKEWNAVVAWTKGWLKEKPAVLGISGGVDSTLTGLIIKAAGSKVIGVMMPCGEQKDIDDARAVCELLEIEPIVVNIGKATSQLTLDILKGLGREPHTISEKVELPEQYETNTPARIRMTTLYGISAMTGGFVANTCNLTEDAVGYSTLYGDSAGSFAPIQAFTKEEVRALAKFAGAPEYLWTKTAIDGMSLNNDGSYKSDEDKLGFSYKEIGDLIRSNIKGTHYDKIVEMYHKNKFKTDIIHLEHYTPDLPNFLESC